MPQREREGEREEGGTCAEGKNMDRPSSLVFVSRTLSRMRRRRRRSIAPGIGSGKEGGRAGSRPSDTWQLGPKQIVFRLPQTHCIDRKPMPDSRPDTEVDWRGEVSRPFGVRKSL